MSKTYVLLENIEQVELLHDQALALTTQNGSLSVLQRVEALHHH